MLVVVVTRKSEGWWLVTPHPDDPCQQLLHLPMPVGGSQVGPKAGGVGHNGRKEVRRLAGLKAGGVNSETGWCRSQEAPTAGGVGHKKVHSVF